MVKVALALAMWGLWQTSGEGSVSAETQASVAEIQNLRYERAVRLPAATAGEACAVLDAAVFAHAAGRALNDLRVFAGDGREVPFALTESEAQPGETASAEVRNVRVHRQRLLFDLRMPLRVSSAVELELAAKDFTAVATVTGEGGDGKPVPLGSYALYDWSSKGLGRATELRLPEQGFAELHVSVQFYGVERGDKPPRVSAEMIRGATVPPSREAQTLYTTVAETSVLQQEAGRSVARLALAPHVPVERVSVVMQPAFAGDFAREVEVVAHPDGLADSAAVETVRGDISAVHLPLYMDSDAEAATIRRLSVDAALAVNLRDAAVVEVGIANGAAPLPVQAVRLEMRQRRVCFTARPGESYTLRYGDPGRVAPVYPPTTGPQMDRLGTGAAAVLGPEQVNAGFHPRAAEAADRRVWVWVGLFAGLSMLGGWVRHSQGRRHG
jgi:hypothetical protein